MLIRSRGPWRSSGPPPEQMAELVPVHVALIGRDEVLAARLGRLLGETSTLELPLVDHVDGDAPVLPAATEVVVLGLAGTGATAIDVLRSLRRRHADLRLVVISDGTAHFDDAFDAGADAWVGDGADDVTLLAAVHGRWASRGSRPDAR